MNRKSPEIDPGQAGSEDLIPGTGDQVSPVRHILVVDDESSLRLLLTKALARAGFTCSHAGDAETAWEMICSKDIPDFDLVISDISMPGMDGIDLLKKVKAYNPDIDFIIMTGYAAQYSYVDIMDAGASDYMTKPFNINSALARIKRIAREKSHLLELKETMDRLRGAMDRANGLATEADEASRAKTFFLAAMSHEIRTPLNGIVGYTDMLMDTRLDDEQKSYLESARFSCDALLSVVNDILDFSKVESGKLHLDKLDFDPEVLCFDAIDVIRTQVNESRVDLVCRVANDVPAKVKGDPHRFRQILLNLLSNAVKFTDRGSITLGLDSDSVGENRVLIKVSVADTGIGVTAGQLDAIFEPFVQSEDDITSQRNGTGLGLAISRNIARKMGGDLRVESTKGKGTTFYFTTPLEIGTPDQGVGIRPAGLKGKHILLVSRNKDDVKILVHALEAAGIKTDLRSLESLSDVLNQSLDYDLGIMDFGKSVKSAHDDFVSPMSGTSPGHYPFEWIACAVPFTGIARIFESAGFKGFIPKPVRRDLLLEMAAHLMGTGKKKGGDAEAGTMLTAHALSENSKTRSLILLVEDNSVNQQLARIMMTRAGYRVDVADNGKEALNVYCRAPLKYDLILMDINMPVMDGFEATLALRSHERENGLDAVPVLALTANVLDDFKQRCREVGMNDFLTKPIKREVVFAAIRKWVRAAV